MYCTDFEYDGQRLSDYGCAVCHISGDADLNTVSLGSKITFNTINMIRQNKFKLMSTQYDEAYTATFEIAKFDCNDRDNYVFSSEEIAKLTRWLNRRKYYKFKMIYPKGECAQMYYMGTFNIDMIVYGGKVVGLQLTLQTNAPFAYYDPIECEMNFSSANDTVSIFDMSDEVGYIYPNNVIIECLSAGELTIHNSQDGNRKTVISKCEKNEILTLDGENKIITSSKSHATLYNDFNYNFIRISNKYENNVEITENIFTASLPCKITFAYSPICKAGIW